MTESQLKEMLGPGTKERWLYWKYATEEQTKRNAVKSELEKIIYSDYVRRKKSFLKIYFLQIL